MVVDDDRDVREAISGLLRDHDFDVLSAENGQDALVQLRARPQVRAIVLDVMMPVMNGATFRGEQLADPLLGPIPLILLTGRSDSAPLAAAMGASVCLNKPVSSEDLLRALSCYR
ncbi:MAG: chemotaxis protein CheY [Pseudomonadota bacterium]